MQVSNNYYLDLMEPIDLSVANERVSIRKETPKTIQVTMYKVACLIETIFSNISDHSLQGMYYATGAGFACTFSPLQSSIDEVYIASFFKGSLMLGNISVLAKCISNFAKALRGSIKAQDQEKKEVPEEVEAHLIKLPLLPVQIYLRGEN